MTVEGWVRDNVADLSEKIVVVTGATSGIGLHTARLLAGGGARVMLACRDTTRAAAVAADMAGVGNSEVGVVELDLSDLASVRAAAAEIGRRTARVDALVNNAGVMAIRRELTVDGFERQLAVNHLGHAALTGLLLPLLVEAPRPRVVTVTSFLARSARIRFDDLQGEASYDPWSAYGQSKLANLLFGLELARRADAAGDRLTSVVVHPGYARTDLVANGPASSSTLVDRGVLAIAGVVVAQGAARGALPSVLAAGGRDVTQGAYLVPRGPGHLRGRPESARPPRKGLDRSAAALLWQRTEELTGVPVLARR